MRKADNVLTAFEPPPPASTPLSEAAAEAWIPRTCFKNGPPSQLGVELELLVVNADQADRDAALHPRHRPSALMRTLSDGGLDGRLTVEPGGQVELSSRPGPDLPHTVDAVRRDLAALHGRAARHGLRLVGTGADPARQPRRVVDHPRYATMEQYFDRWGPAGRIMMCSTASVQVNVEAGLHLAGRQRATDDFRRRWDLLHAVGPALIAAFANSPRLAGRLTGFKSTRQAVWGALDPARTGAPPVGCNDVADWWTRRSLDAPVMLIRRERGSWTAPVGLTFRQWIRHGRSAVPDHPAPTTDDLAYHLTTLFPPVRPRGHFEVRYIDAQPGQRWIVPSAVVSVLMDDDAAGQGARAACEPVEGRWADAARLGLDDAELARAATRVLELSAAALAANPETARFAGPVQGYLERWTSRGRCPADDAAAEPSGWAKLTTDEQIGDLP